VSSSPPIALRQEAEEEEEEEEVDCLGEKSRPRDPGTGTLFVDPATQRGQKESKNCTQSEGIDQLQYIAQKL